MTRKNYINLTIIYSGGASNCTLCSYNPELRSLNGAAPSTCDCAIGYYDNLSIM